MKKKLSYKILSGYTIAKNCCDDSDIEIGINELQNFISIMRSRGFGLSDYKKAVFLLKQLESKKESLN
jgi:hypothetical protein